jgi:hypothetical protein
LGFLDVFSGISVYARPHPGPLPSVFATLRRDRAEAEGGGGRGEGEHFTLLDSFSIFMAVTDSVSLAGMFDGYCFDLVTAEIKNALSVRRRAIPSLATTENVSNPLEAT